MSETAAHHAYLWEFEVEPESVAAFLRYYGPDGEWARLFRQAQGYLETLLLRDEANPVRYLTIDRWRSRADLEAFMADHRAEYEAMDLACESFTRREASLGSFRECAAGG